jgi:hypothetical protein
MLKTIFNKLMTLMAIIMLCLGMFSLGLFLNGYFLLNDTRISDLIFVPVQNILMETKNDDLVDSIVNSCSISNSTIKRIRCVESYFDNYYFYNNTTTLDAKELFTKGGDCKAASYQVCAILKRLNINCSLKVLKGHEIAIVDDEDFYIIVDNGWFDWREHESLEKI